MCICWQLRKFDKMIYGENIKRKVKSNYHAMTNNHWEFQSTWAFLIQVKLIPNTQLICIFMQPHHLFNLKSPLLLSFFCNELQILISIGHVISTQELDVSDYAHQSVLIRFEFDVGVKNSFISLKQTRQEVSMEY